MSGMKWWNGSPSFLPSMHFCGKWSLPSAGRAILFERVPFTEITAFILKDRILLVSQLQASLLSLCSRPSWEVILVLHGKHKNQNNNKEQANKWNIDTKISFMTLLVEKKALEVLLISVWLISTWQHNFYHLIAPVAAASLFAMETENT